MNVNEIGNTVYNGAVGLGNKISNTVTQGANWLGKSVTWIRENGSAGLQKILRFIRSAWQTISSFVITHKDGLVRAVVNNRYALGLCGALVAGIAIGALGMRELTRRNSANNSEDLNSQRVVLAANEVNDSLESGAVKSDLTSVTEGDFATVTMLGGSSVPEAKSDGDM